MKTNYLNEILLTELKWKQRMHNGKGSKLNYSCKNETNRRIPEMRN